MRNGLNRIAVIGTSCSGKSTLARQLSEIFGHKYIELDALHWGPGWTPRPMDEFQGSVSRAASTERWIIDGNYSKVRDTVLQRATTLIWLNYSFSKVFSRALIRTVRRSLFAEELYSGNRETIAKSFFSRESILWWVITTYRRRRREYQQIRESGRYPHLSWLEFRHPKEADQFIVSITTDHA